MRTASVRVIIWLSGRDVECLRIRVAISGCEGVCRRVRRVTMNLCHHQLGLPPISSIDVGEGIPTLMTVGCGEWSIHFNVRS